MRPRERGEDRERKQVELRNRHRAEIAARKRAANSLSQNSAPSSQFLSLPFIKQYLSQCLSEDHVHTSLSSLQCALSNQGPEPMQQALELQIHCELPKIFERYRGSERVVGVWLACVANLAAGPRSVTMEVASCGLIPLLCSSLPTQSLPNLHQAILALGNLCSDSPSLRDQSIALNAHLFIHSRLQVESSLPLCRISSWTLSNMCRGSPPISIQAAEEILPVFKELLRGRDEVTVASALYGLGYITYAGLEYVQLALREAGLVVEVGKWVEFGEAGVKLPALKLIGNIVSGDHLQTQKVLEMPILPLLQKCINSFNPSIRREVFFILSNICAGTLPQIDLLLGSSMASELILALEDHDSAVRSEALWAFANLTKTCSQSQLLKFTNNGLFQSLKGAFLYPDMDYKQVRSR